MTAPPTRPLLDRPLAVASAGVGVFAADLERQDVPVERVDWRPPVPGAAPALAALAPHAAEIAAANDTAVARLQEARPHLVGVGVARDLLPGMGPRTILHAGPPVVWEEMSGPLRGAVIGAVLHEGLAPDPEQAERLAASGALEFGPCHERGAVGPMAGVVSSSMPMWIVENHAHGNRAYCTLNEGLGKVLRYGAFDQTVQDRLRWMAGVLAPVLAAALARLDDPIDLKAMIAQALQMGDEGHNRHRAGTSLLLRALLPALLEADRPTAERVAASRFIAGNDHFFLNLVMPAAKSATDAAAGVRGSTIVTTLARNGTTFGIRTSGTGERWFTGPAGIVQGLYLPGFAPEDANPDIGDSAITETVGLGGFAMAAAPAIVALVGGTPGDAVAATESMDEITWAESTAFRIPALAFRGTPTGIDAREVVRTGVLPLINTGMAHREAGVGQIGAGIVRPPIEAFVGAVRALADSLSRR